MKLLQQKTIIAGAATTIFGLSGLIYSTWRQSLSQYPEGLSYIFPILIFILALLTGISLLRSQPTEPPPANAASTRPTLIKLGVMMALLWGYAFLLGVAGFIIATFAFQLLALLIVFKKRGTLWVIGAPLLLTALFTLFFEFVLAVPLPKGVGAFYAINTLLM